MIFTSSAVRTTNRRVTTYINQPKLLIDLSVKKYHYHFKNPFRNTIKLYLYFNKTQYICQHIKSELYIVLKK